jgi:UDP-glucose 4-epimerase
MKTILLLGGYGFIGTNILKYIDSHYSNDYQVIVFDKMLSHPLGIKFNCIKKYYSGDFSDETNVDSIFNDNNIDIVIHLLSSTIPATSSNAQYDVESNLIPTLKLLAIMDKHEVKKIVYMSSGGAIYGDFLQKVHNEEDSVYPKSSYGIVKLAIEKYLLSYSELYGFQTLILRLSNPYGPYHFNNKQGVINIAIRKALTNETLQIWGSGDGVKDYIYIDDVCDIIMKLISEGIQTNVYNLAASNALSVNDIVEAIRKEIPSFKTEHVASSSYDVQNFELDITKLRHHLGNYKMTPFVEALQKTIKWQKDILLK